MKRIIFLIGTLLTLPVFASMPTNTHYKYTKVYEAATGETVDSKPSINFQRDVVFYSKDVLGVERIIVKPWISEDIYGAPITVASNTPFISGLSYEFFSNNGLKLENEEVIIRKGMEPRAEGMAEPVITDRVGDEVYVLYYEGGGINENGTLPQAPTACGTTSSDIAWTMKLNIYRAKVNIVTGEVTTNLILGTGKSYCDGPRYDVVSIQAPFSINSSGQVAISAYVHRREEFTATPFRHILVSSPSDPVGITGIAKPRVVVERHTTVDEAGLTFFASLGSPQINDSGDIALLGISYLPESNPRIEGKYLYFIPSNTNTLQILAVESSGSDPGHYAQLSGRPSINNSKQVALFVRKTEGEFQNPGILIANASCGRSGQPNCPQGEEDFDWVIGDTRNSKNQIIEKYRGEFKELTRDILLFDKAIKKNGADNSVLFPYMQGFSFGANSYVEKSNNGGEEGGEIIKESIFSSNFYNPDGGLIIREESRLDNGLVESLNYGRFSASNNGTLAVSLSTKKIYEIRPCEADGVCVDFGQATFAPDTNADGIVDLLRGRPVVARVKVTDASNGIAKHIEAMGDSVILGGFTLNIKSPSSDSLDFLYYEANSFFPSASQIDYSFNTNIDGISHEKNGKVDVWVPKDNNFRVAYLPLSCPNIEGSTINCASQDVIGSDDVIESSIVNIWQMFPVRPNDVRSVPLNKEASSTLAGGAGVEKDIFKVWYAAKNATNDYIFPKAGAGIVPVGYFKKRYQNESYKGVGITLKPAWWNWNSEKLDFASIFEQSDVAILSHEFTHLFDHLNSVRKNHVGRATIDGYNFFQTTHYEAGSLWRKSELFQALVSVAGTSWPGNQSWVDTTLILNEKFTPTKKEENTSIIENIVFGFLKEGNEVKEVKGLRKFGNEITYEGESNLRLIIKNAKNEIVKNIPLPEEFEVEENFLDEDNNFKTKSLGPSFNGPMVLNVPISLDDAAYSVELNGSSIFYENLNLHVLDTMIDYTPDDAFRSNPEPSRMLLKEALIPARDLANSLDYSGAALNLTNNFLKAAKRLLINNSKSRLDSPLELRFYLKDFSNEISTAAQRLKISAAQVAQPVRLFEISLDKNSYNNGERAIIKSREAVSLEDKEMEYVLVAKIDGTPQRIDRLKEDLFVSETSPLITGTHIYSIDVYKQNKRFAKNIEEALRDISSEIIHIDKELEQETDSEKRIKLEKRKNLLAARWSELKNKLSLHRQSVGVSYTKDIFVE
ncbi:MAG: hypothetical protein M9962_13900 [Oligoflexia bacterium]|nr:hypothetical protein [Oligoflexia bacterium]